MISKIFVNKNRCRKTDTCCSLINKNLFELKDQHPKLYLGLVRVNQ